MTISDIMAKLYGKTGRRVTNIASIISSIGVVAFQATAMGYILHYFFLIPVGDSTIICVLTLTLYSTFGGIRAVAYTDVFQFIIIILAIPTACFIVYGIEAVEE
ncbi:sodium:solute symporter family protein [Hyalomma marginatum]|nr:sodium:solute symporter family protein [Hyalomma marginatum]